VFLDVKACSNGFRSLDICFFAWSFSMFSRLRFLMVVSPADGHCILANVDGVEILD
jgi:hypothetical protein